MRYELCKYLIGKIKITSYDIYPYLETFSNVFIVNLTRIIFYFGMEAKINF